MTKSIQVLFSETGSRQRTTANGNDRRGTDKLQQGKYIHTGNTLERNLMGNSPQIPYF